MEKTHPHAIPEGTTPAQVWFNWKNHKDGGKCVICGQPAEWNDAAERYERFDREECRSAYREEFKKRMLDKYGKVHLLDDPDQQKKMLHNRSISGTYEWSGGVVKTPYTGSYEHDFLRYLDVFLHWNSTDVLAPAPQVFYYDDEDGKRRFYIPDFYLPSINTLVEIKDGGDNPNMHHNRQDVDARKEALKDKVMREQKSYNFVKVSDKNYATFLNFLIDVKNLYADAEKQEGFPVVRIEEQADLLMEQLIAEMDVAPLALGNNRQAGTVNGPLKDKPSHEGDMDFRNQLLSTSSDQVDKEEVVEAARKTRENDQLSETVRLALQAGVPRHLLNIPAEPVSERMEEREIRQIQQDMADSDFAAEIEKIWADAPLVSFDDEMLSEGIGDSLMPKYETSRKMMRIHSEAGNADGIKHELSKLWYMYVVSERYYGEENLRAKTMVLNEFINGMRRVSEREPGFSFDAYLAQTPYSEGAGRLGNDRTRDVSKFIREIVAPA